MAALNRYDTIMARLKAKPIGHAQGIQAVHVTEQELQALEREMDTTLPDDYREFLRDYGLYDVPTALFPIEPNSEFPGEGAVEHFSGVALEGGDSSYDLRNSFDNMRQCFEDWPEEWLPIADEGSGNVIALSTKGEDKGTVYYYVVSRMPNEQYVFHVADSFDEFMNSLKLFDDD